MAAATLHPRVADLPNTKDMTPCIYGEDTTCRKVICAIPVIGILTNLCNTIVLIAQVSQSHDTKEWIVLVNIRNEYLAASIVNSVVSTALVIIPLALGILGPAMTVIAAIIIGFNVLGIPIAIRSMVRNHELVGELKRGGWRPGMKLN